MYILGHAGLTAAAARAADRDIDLRVAALLALGPDILDKPLRHVLPGLTTHNSRSVGHTLLAWAVVALALAAWKRRPGPGWLLWACFAGHAVLDRLWLGANPVVFLWPWLGPFPPPVREGPAFDAAFAYNLAGEAVGLLVVLWLMRRYGLFDAERRRAFWRTGRLENPIIRP